MKFRKVVVTATVLALPVAANAQQPVAGLYIGGGAGVNIMQNELEKVTAPRFSSTAHLKPEVGPAFDLSLGYGLGNGLRAELEGFYSYNSFHGVNVGGHEQKFGPMVNVLYDFPIIPQVQPYIGAGVGYLWANENNLHAAGITSSNSTKGSWAYQGIIGAAFPIAAAPGLALTADYRFIGLGSERRYPNAGISGTRIMADDYNHVITVGFRYTFGAATPPPPAAPAAVPASPVSRSYLVFFDWDKAVLTERARQIVSEAAANSTKVQYTRLEVNGYTDTSGTATYNQGLSIRRAQAVAAELVKDGVPKAAISIQGFGETHLLVQTGPGVREPQNRRVEIIIR
ncbi:OmpA family protein [Rhodopila sp.]|uniref:OmpA family protein n=1 Tax=Rhodopila sp. TaxID=2480087 RepID=UPI003D11F5CC